MRPHGAPKGPRKVEYTTKDRRQLADILDRVSSRNDMNPRTLSAIVLDIAAPGARPPRVDPRTGMVEHNGRRLFVDQQSLAELAALRTRNTGSLQSEAGKHTGAEWKRTRNKETTAQRAREAAKSRNPSPVEAKTWQEKRRKQLDKNLSVRKAQDD